MKKAFRLKNPFIFLLAAVFVYLTTPTFAQTGKSRTEITIMQNGKKIKLKMEDAWLKLESLEKTLLPKKERHVAAELMSDNIGRLEREMDKLQGTKRRVYKLKRKIRRKKRLLEREEEKLVARIQDIERYVAVDERLSKTAIADYYKQVALLSNQLLLNRADQRRVKRLQRRARRLLKKRRCYSRSYSYNSCGKSYAKSYSRCYKKSGYRNHHRRHHHHRGNDTSPWFLAFAALFGINVLIGGVIAYRTLRK